MSKKLFTTAAILSFATMASAQDVGDFNAGAGLSILGPMVEGSYQVTPDFAVRGIAFGAISLTDTVDLDEYTVDGSITLNGGGLLMDYYPTNSGWRVSGGVVVTDFSLDGDFTGPENFVGNISLKKDVAPLVTTGYRHTFRNNMTVSGDLGVMVNGLVASSNNVDPLVQDEIDSLNADLDQIPVVPFISIMVGYTF